MPFSSRTAFFGLSRLAVWWLRLGINIERIAPGNPQRNGRHERMHLTLKQDGTKPPAFNILKHQERFDEFMETFNNDRPHQALNMRYQGELYTPSARTFHNPEPLEYPLHDRTIRVTHCGRLCFERRKISLSRVFAGQDVGIREVSDDIWRADVDGAAAFMEYDLGFFVEDDRREYWSVTIKLPWCITFKFKNGEFSEVMIEDYHRG